MTHLDQIGAVTHAWSYLRSANHIQLVEWRDHACAIGERQLCAWLPLACVRLALMREEMRDTAARATRGA